MYDLQDDPEIGRDAFGKFQAWPSAVVDHLRSQRDHLQRREVAETSRNIGQYQPGPDNDNHTALKNHAATLRNCK